MLGTIFSIVFGLVVIAVGAVLAMHGYRDGVTVVAIFSGFTTLAVWMALFKRQTRAHLQALAVVVQTGVPLRAQKKNGFVVGAGLFAVGVIGLVAGGGIASDFFAISLVLTLLGALMLALTAFGVLSQNSIQFEPGGLRFGRRGYTFFLAWENIAAIVPGVRAGHDTLLIEPASVDLLDATVQGDEGAVERLAKEIASNRRLLGASLEIVPVHYGADVGLFVHAIRQIIADADVQARLLGRWE